MKTKLAVYFTSLFLLLQAGMHLSAQVTIGSNNPPKEYSTLQIDGKAGGLRLPILDAGTRTTLQAKLGSDAESVGLLIYNTSTSQVEYWDGTQWVAAKGGSGSVTVPAEPWLVSGGTTEATSNTENIYQMGSVTIGSDATAESSAALNVATMNKGVLFPKVTLTSTTDATTILSPATGLLVYNTGTNAGFTDAGYVIWDGAKWAKISTDITLPTEPWRVSGGATEATANNEDIYHLGHITIGSSAAIDATAALNVTATDKGVLLPRIPLKSATDQTTITSPTTGLLVYNTGTEATFPTEGYMYWNGTQWRLISTSTSVAPKATLVCGQARLDPEQVIISGTEISAGTVLRIPYTVGNGGMYNAAIIKTTDATSDVQATISSGLFENGSGYLAFNVTGTPTNNQATPTGITFDLTPFYDANPSLDATTGCKTITVGTEIKADIVSIATMDNLKLVNDGGVTGYATQLTTPDGKFSVRAFIVSSNFNSSAGAFGANSIYGINLQIRNNTENDIIIAGQFNWQWGGSGGNGANYLGLQPGLWSGDDAQVVANASQTYWANYVSDTRGTGWAADPAAPSTSVKNYRGHFVHWADMGVYADGIPERRTYSWTVNDGSVSKTAYILTFSSSALKPSDRANSTTCPNGICSGTKVFMMIDEITAP